MKIIRYESLIGDRDSYLEGDLCAHLQEIDSAVKSVVWPLDSTIFKIKAERKANGVRPIKDACMLSLKKDGWQLEARMSIASRKRPGKIDAVKETPSGKFFAVEWETGNISSSHRAINKISIGLIDGTLEAGVVILPSRKFYRYLTDRVGNFEEIEPYFPMWRKLELRGLLYLIVVEFDEAGLDVPQIPKGTDGRALR